MMHRKRRWSVHFVGTLDELAEKLAQHTWTLCTGFAVSGHEEYVFLNDSTSEDGAQEYAVLKRVGETVTQVESITFSWCDAAQSRRYIQRALDGEFDAEGWRIHQRLHIEDAANHGRCPWCV